MELFILKSNIYFLSRKEKPPSTANVSAMAYVFDFPQDVTDLIYSMRDWRYEMVRDGGKTPSASCFALKDPSFWPYFAPITDMVKGREYIIPYPDMPAFTSDMPNFSYELNVPLCELHPYDGVPTLPHHSYLWEGSIDIWKHTPTGKFGRPRWERMSFSPTRPRNETRAAHPRDLWFQCEPC